MPLPATWIGSIHKSKGRSGYRPEAVVVHIIEGSLKSADHWFNDPQSKVSAHYGVGKNGEIHQYVGESDTAWHAGRVYEPTWEGIRPGVNPNLYTIGIEHEGHADTEWTDAMYRASADLIRNVCTRWSIPIDRDHVVGHREIYARKTCPGHEVDLEKLVRIAREGATEAGVYNFVPDQGKAAARVNLNVRKGAPTTAAPVVRTIPKGEDAEYVGWTSNGLTVNGNAHWYRNADGDYFWAGGTDRPIPGL